MQEETLEEFRQRKGDRRKVRLGKGLRLHRRGMGEPAGRKPNTGTDGPERFYQLNSHLEV